MEGLGSLMANYIHPQYAPPVTGSLVRKLWRMGIGSNGRLVGFGVNDYVDDGGFVAFTLEAGKFISNGSVVESDSISFNLLSSEAHHFFIYGYYDEGSDTSDIAISKDPKDSWAVIGEMINGAWYPEEDVTIANLKTLVSQHVPDEDIHILANQNAAFEASESPSSINHYLTKSEIDVGTIFSPSDMQVAVMGSSGKNESGIRYDPPDCNMIVECPGCNEGGLSVSGKNELITHIAGVILADGRWWPDMFKDAPYAGMDIIKTVFNALSKDIDTPTPVSKESTEYTIKSGVHDAILSYVGIDLTDLSGEASMIIPGFMFKAIDGVISAKISCITASGEKFSKSVVDIEHGKWIPLFATNIPEESLEIKGLKVSVSGANGTKFEISPMYMTSVLRIEHSPLQQIPEPFSFRVEPVCGEGPVDGVSCFLDMETRSQREMPMFANYYHPEEKADEGFIGLAASMIPQGMMISREAADWGSPRAGYCMSDASVTGATMVVGGYYGSETKRSVIAYSPLGNHVTNISMGNSLTMRKSASADFSGKMLITGGEGVDSRQSVVLNLCNQTHITLPDMIESREGHGCVSIDESNAIVWMGKDSSSSARLNLLSHTWTEMPSILVEKGEVYGKLFKGGRLANRSHSNRNFDRDPLSEGAQSCIVFGSGGNVGETGSKINLASYSNIALGMHGMVSQSNVAVTQYGVAMYQSKDQYAEYSGCFDLFSGTERMISIPTTGRGNCGNSLQGNGNISYGPWEQYGEHHTNHVVYSFIDPMWITGIALKWET